MTERMTQDHNIVSPQGCRGPESAVGFFSLLVGLLMLGGMHSASAQSISFDDVSDRAGIATSGSGLGAAVHDFDGDGWDDVFVAVSGGASALFRNNGDGTFTDIAEAAGVAVSGRHTVALWGDADNDGLTDLFVGRTISGENRLFRNAGDGTFEDITMNSGIDPIADVSTAAFGDYDGDGSIDLFLAIDRGPDILYRNTKAEQGIFFEDVSDLANIAGSPATVPMQATWIDYDQDGDLDLFCVHDSRTSSRLYRNSGYLPLSNVASAARIDTYPSENVCCNMGTAWGDVNGDGHLDAYVTRIGHSGLYRNNGDGTFDDVSEAVGASRNGMSWGVILSDFDNDADLDIFVVSTSGYDGTPTLLYQNHDGQFTETGSQAGVSHLLEAQGLAAGDFNNDGLVDIFIPSHDGNNRLFENTTRDAGQWVELELTGVLANTTAIGTRVEVIAAGNRQLRIVSGGDSYASQSSTRLHFGLGSASRIDTVRVYWSGSEMEYTTDLAVGQRHSLSEGLSTARVILQPETPADMLLQNYPNPFERTTTVRYTVPETGIARLDVLDLLGRHIAVLADGFHAAGMHTVTLAANDLPDATYICRLTTRGRRSIRKVLLMR